jgi:hypothetical protein
LIYLSHVGIRGFFAFAQVSGGRNSIHGASGLDVVAPGRAAERFKSKSLQPVRVTLGDGPSL